MRRQHTCQGVNKYTARKSHTVYTVYTLYTYVYTKCTGTYIPTQNLLQNSVASVYSSTAQAHLHSKAQRFYHYRTRLQSYLWAAHLENREIYEK